MSSVTLRERFLQRQREEETRQLGLRKFTSQIALQSVENSSNETVEAKRRRNEQLQLAQEDALEKMTRTAMLQARKKAQQQEQEEVVAAALEAKRNDETRRRREIQKICEEDPSLQALQSKLRLAYISKQRDEQIREKVALTAVEREAGAAAEVVAEAARRRADEAQRAREDARRVAAAASMLSLQEQLRDKELRDFVAMEGEAAKERAMVDAILARIAAEDGAEAAQRAAARAETVRIIEEFKVSREATLRATKEREAAEEGRIRAYAEANAAREAEAEAKRAEAVAVREAAYRAVATEQVAVRVKAEEEDALKWLLVEEEAERRRAEAETKRRGEVERARRDMLVANEGQRRLREIAAKEAAAREAALISQFLSKCAEDDAKEQLAVRARKEARARYLEEIQVQKDVKAAQLQMQQLKEAEAEEEVRQKERFRLRVVEEARRRMLAEHADVLRGNLPRGVIHSQEDLQLLKAFDSNADGVLTVPELELAAAAFHRRA